ncbi:MAG: hypothetical protein IKU49_05640 [Prevotella sp.]|nr:hypothetical protein [Prevotella sp.]
MKQFLITLSKFGALLLVMLIAIEVGLLYRPNVYSYKRQYVEDHQKDIKVLLLGSSHVEEGVNPALLGEGAFNMAISARLNEYDAALAEKYVPGMDSLKAVIMHMDYSTFLFGRLKHNEQEVNTGAFSLMGTCHCMHTKYMGIHLKPFWYWSEILNSKLNYMSRFWNKADKILECDSLGYCGLDVNERLTDWEYRNLADDFDPSVPIDRETYDKLWNVYETIARVTQQQGARLILVHTPVYKTYQDAIHPEALRDIENFVQKLQQKYPNVEYHNFLFAEGFTPDDFNDSSHLTSTGADKFSRMLYDVIYPQK